MTQLHGCNDIKQIIVNSVPIPDTTDLVSAKNYYRELVLDAMSSREYLDTVFAAGGFEQIDVGEFTRDHFRLKVVRLSLTMAQMDDVHTELSRMGWLRESKELKGPRFFQRKWRLRQCLQALHNRIIAEQNAIRYAYITGRNPEDDGAMQEYGEIVAQQRFTLQDMKRATEKLRHELTVANAIEVSFLDSKLRQGWGGYDASTTAMLSVCIGAHFQQIGRLIIVHSQLERKKIPVPFGYPTLLEIVDGFYDETSSIFQDFLVAVAKGEDELEGLMASVAKHAKSGFDHVEQADQLLKFAAAIGT